MASDPDSIRQANLWDEWARHFPQLYPDRDPSAIVDFLFQLAPNGAALELGPGTGRVTVPLAAAGMSVVAVEVSSSLAEYLRANSLNHDISIVVGDMATYTLARDLDVIFAARSTFFHLTDQERQIQCLVNAAQMLKPDGVIVLDCFVPYVEPHWGSRELQLSSVDDHGVDLRATVIDRLTQRIIYREIRLTGEGARVLPVEQRYCTPAELDLMARIAGLVLHERYSDYNYNPFTADSHRHVSVYRLASTSKHSATPPEPEDSA